MPERIWTYYDAKGDRVRKRHAVFAGKETLASAGAPARMGQASPDGVVYRDVYLLTKPDDRRRFTTRKRMLQWFAEAVAASSR